MKHHWFRSIILANVLYIFLTGPQVWGQNPSTSYYLILDGSGSMWQKIDGEFKIELARKVLKDMVNKLPDDTQIALLAYGHRREKDCDDIEWILPLETLSRKRFAEKVDALNPIGRTPISKALETTISQISDSDETATILLISDGLETCEGNPCDIVRIAKQKQISILTHVVGLGIEENDVSQLECIAQAGGGFYYDAYSYEELVRALDQAVESSIAINNAYISIKAEADNKLTDVSIQLIPHDKSQRDIISRTYTSAETNPRIMNVPAGTYDLLVRALEFKGNTRKILSPIEIRDSDTVRKEVDFSTGNVKIVITRNGTLSDAVVSISPTDERIEVAKGRSYATDQTNPIQFSLTSGLYDISLKMLEVENKPEKIFNRIEVLPNETIEFAHNISSGTLLISTIHGNDSIDAVIRIYPVAQGSQVAINRTYGKQVSFELLPGKYRILSKPINKAHGQQKEEIIEVISEKKTSKSLLFQ